MEIFQINISPTDDKWLREKPYDCKGLDLQILTQIWRSDVDVFLEDMVCFQKVRLTLKTRTLPLNRLLIHSLAYSVSIITF